MDKSSLFGLSNIGNEQKDNDEQSFHFCSEDLNSNIFFDPFIHENILDFSNTINYNYFNPINNNDEYNILSNNNTIKDSDKVNEIEIIINNKEELNCIINSKENTNNTKNNVKNNHSKEINNLGNKIGKKRNNTSKRKRNPHNKLSPDNIIVKIHTHFFNFIIILINTILKQSSIKTDNPKDYFRNINGKEKKIIKKYNVNEIKAYPISDILKFPNSGKCSDIKHNKKLFEHIEKKDNAILQKFLNMTYIDVFKNYFYTDKKDIIIEGEERLKIRIPYNIEDVLLKIKAKEDIQYENKIKKVIENYLFDDNINKTAKKKLFKAIRNL